MPLPIVPIAVIASAVALVKNIHISPVVQAHEDVLDDIDEGLSAHRDPDGNQINSAYRWKRTIQLGQTGPAMEIDASFLGRLKINRIS
jgi:hypothetical protein